MDPGQRNVRRHRPERDRVVPDSGDVLVGGPVVGNQLAVRRNGAEHESMEFVLAKALDHLEPGTPRLAAVDLDRAGDQHLADTAAARGQNHRVVLGAERDNRLVGLDQAAERCALGVDHGAAQLGAQHPGGALGAKPELVLQLQRRDAVGVRGHQKRRPEPDRQRQLAGVHNRAGGHRGLTTAVGALVLDLDRPDARA